MLAAASEPARSGAAHPSLLALLTGSASPDGANDPACKPSAEHPRPVVLVHGTFNNMRQTWNTLSPQLARQGYCVFALNFGDTSGGLSPLKAVGQVATQIGAMWLVRRVCPSCTDQLWNSAVVRKLNRGTMTLPGIAYTVISTRLDNVVVPFESQQLPPGPGVTNIVLQEDCPSNEATHLSIPDDPDALARVRHALDPRTPLPACA